MPSRSPPPIATDDYPSLLWIAIPPILLVSAYYVRKWYLARKLRLYGIGKGAPGFQTSVRRVGVTPEIAARLRRGEDVSPEEIAQAIAQVEKEGVEKEHGESRTEKQEEELGSEQPVKVNEWLPDTIAAPKRRSKRKRK